MSNHRMTAGATARPFHEFRAQCAALLASVIDEPIEIALSLPPQPEFGDLASTVAFQLAKLRRRAPQAIAADLAVALAARLSDTPLVGSVQPMGGYINFSLNTATFVPHVIDSVLAAAATYGTLQPETARSVVIEHTSVNPNKAWHTGHGRNAILGDVLGRVFRAAGHRVDIQNYIDDTGKQVADMIYGLSYFGHLNANNELTIETDEKIDHALGRIYVDLYRILDRAPSLHAEQAALDEAIDWPTERVMARCTDIEAALALARAHSAPDRQIDTLSLQRQGWQAVAALEPEERFTRHTAISADLADLADMQRAAAQVLHDLETGRYRHIVHTCLHAQLQTAWRLGIFYDLLTWESDIVQAHLLTEALAALRQSPRIYQASTGKLAGCLVLTMGDGTTDSDAEDDEHTLDKVLVRSNGIPTYTGKDVAYHFWKYGLLTGDLRYALDTVQPNGQPLMTSTPTGGTRPHITVTDVINVIAVHQAYPQQVVAEALRITGHHTQHDGFHHLAYGMVDVRSADGRVAQSGRRGTGLLTDDVLDSAVETAYERVQEKRGDDLSEQEMRAIAEAVATGALRYVMCQFNPLKDIAIDIPTVVNFEGNTGPYLQYAYVRTQAILRRARQEKDLDPADWQAARSTLLTAPAERALLLVIARLPDIVEIVTRDLAVNLLADYCYDLASTFTQFYRDCRVLAAETPDLLHARLLLVEATAQTMRNAYGLLGLPLVERL